MNSTSVLILAALGVLSAVFAALTAISAKSASRRSIPTSPLFVRTVVMLDRARPDRLTLPSKFQKRQAPAKGRIFFLVLFGFGDGRVVALLFPRAPAWQGRAGPPVDKIERRTRCGLRRPRSWARSSVRSIGSASH